MTTPAVTAESATAPSATEFEQDIGQMFGDYSTAGEPPESEESAAGTTPAEPAAGTVDGTASDSAPAGSDTSGTASDGTTPAAQAPVVEDDPFKDTTPAQYVVNGQSVPVEDIRVFKEGGAVIRPESLPNILSKLAERDTLSEQSRTAKQQYDTLAKVSEWTGADNQTVTGPQAAVERIVAHAAVLSENQLLVEEILKCPDLHAAGFLTTELRPDGKGGQIEAVIFRPDAISRLQTQNELRQLKATQAIRDHYKGVIAQASKAAPAPVNYEQAAPALVSDVAKAANLDASVLTPADRAELAELLPSQVKDGQVSLTWQKVVKNRIELRTEQKASAAKLVTTTTDAIKKGQANLAAAARGLKPGAPKPAAAPARQPSPQSERAQNEGDAFDALLSSGAAAMRANR